MIEFADTPHGPWPLNTVDPEQLKNWLAEEPLCVFRQVVCRSISWLVAELKLAREENAAMVKQLNDQDGRAERQHREWTAKLLVLYDLLDRCQYAYQSDDPVYDEIRKVLHARNDG